MFQRFILRVTTSKDVLKMFYAKTFAKSFTAVDFLHAARGKSTAAKQKKTFMQMFCKCFILHVTTV